MTDEQALLAAVVAAPADDLPRLVYADWLDEHGLPERAEFIRVQVELAASPGPTETRADELQRRELVLLDDHRWAILGDVPGCMSMHDGMGSQHYCLSLYPVNSGPSFGITFRRGFLELVYTTWRSTFGHLKTLLASHPVAEVTLTTWPEFELIEDDDHVRLAGTTEPVLGLVNALDLPIDGEEFRRAVIRDLLMAWCPGVRFTLPEFAPVDLTARTLESPLPVPDELTGRPVVAAPTVLDLVADRYGVAVRDIREVPRAGRGRYMRVACEHQWEPRYTLVRDNPTPDVLFAAVELAGDEFQIGNRSGIVLHGRCGECGQVFCARPEPAT